MATVAEHLAARLAAAGVRHAFGIPGGEVLTLLDALARAGVAFHLVKHETCGGFMADAIAQLDGAPAVLVGTLGPGVTNLVTAVAHAFLDRTPMLVVTGCVDADVAASYTHQVLDHAALLAPITKWTTRLSPGSAAVAVDRAVGLAATGVPGPVHLDLPVSVAGAEAGPLRAPSARPAPAGLAPGDALETLLAWLGAAERPLILAGLGVVRQGAHVELGAVARRAGAAVITTYKAKGVIDEADPLVVGGAGLSPVADRALLRLVRAADLILCVGYDPVEMRDPWTRPWDADVRCASIGWAPSDHGVYAPALDLVADLRVALSQLLERLPDRGARTWRDGAPAACRQEIAASLRPAEPGAWGPHAVVETCRRAFPPDTIATVDTGAHRILLSHVWTCPGPGGLLQSTGLCTMGYALPAAIGAALVRPGRPIVCFTGDGGLEMVLGELATARDLGVPVIVVCFADRSLALIELKQRRMGLPSRGVDFAATDLVAAARALGGTGVRVESAGALERACRAALAARTFTVIEAVIDKREYAGQM